MIRRFNYKGKQKLHRNRIHIDFNWDEDRIESFDIDLNTDGIEIPEDATVFVESYHKGQYERFNLGKVGDFEKQEDLKLETTGYSENVRIKVLIVNEDNVILRLATGLRPESGDDKEPILPVVPRDIGQKVWQVDYQGDRPVLEINEKIPDIQGKASSDPMFIMSVYPAVIREILNRIVFIEDIEEFDKDAAEWQVKWLQFAKEQHPEDKIPEKLNPGDEVTEDEFFQWIDDIVDSFCDSRRKEWKKVRTGDEE